MTIIIDALLLNATLDSQGLYPQATIDNAGNRKEGTLWQEGWNDCHRDLRNKTYFYNKWFEKLPLQEQENYEKLLVEDVIKLSIRNDIVTPWLLMNDIFAFACADGEDVSPNDFKNILDIYRKFGYDGLIAWVAIKQNKQPLDELITIEYLAAFDMVKKIYGES